MGIFDSLNLNKNKKAQVSALDSFRNPKKKKPSLKDIIGSTSGPQSVAGQSPIARNIEGRTTALPSTPTSPPRPAPPSAPTTTTTPTGITTPPSATPTISSVVGERAGAGKSERDILIERLTSAISGVEAFDPSERRAQLEEERGIAGQRKTIGSFEEEIAQTFDFLDTLEADIKERTGDFLVSESQRRRLLASESDPLIQGLGKLTRGLGVAESRLTREEGAISDILGEEKEEAQSPLELLFKELGIRGDITDLTEDEESRSRESAIAGLIDQGIVDPLELHDLLNFDEDGNKIGDVSISEIQSVRESLEPKKRDISETVKDGRRVLIDTQTGETIADLGADLEGQLTQEKIAEIQQDIKSSQLEAGGSGQIQSIINSFASAGERDSARGAIATFNTSQRLIDALDKAETGLFSGVLRAGIPLPFTEGSLLGTQKLPIDIARKSDAFNEFQASATVFTANFIKAISGAQVSDKERKFLMKALPSEFKQEVANRAGIKVILNFLREDLRTLGINVTDFPDDISDPFAGGSLDEDFDDFLDED